MLNVIYEVNWCITLFVKFVLKRKKKAPIKILFARLNPNYNIFY